jgi:hypothetical protein
MEHVTHLEAVKTTEMYHLTSGMETVGELALPGWSGLSSPAVIGTRWLLVFWGRPDPACEVCVDCLATGWDFGLLDGEDGAGSFCPFGEEWAGPAETMGEELAPFVGEAVFPHIDGSLVFRRWVEWWRVLGCDVRTFQWWLFGPRSWMHDASQVQLARGSSVLSQVLFQPIHPIFLLVGVLNLTCPTSERFIHASVAPADTQCCGTDASLFNKSKTMSKQVSLVTES